MPGLKKDLKTQAGWLSEGETTIGITAGASTPNSVIGKVINEIIEMENLTGELQELLKN